MSYELKGTIKVINDTQVINDTFSKREFVILDESGQYPQTILLQFTKDGCSKLDNRSVGDVVNVSFNLNGREWTNPKDGSIRFFNSLDAWKISPLGVDQSEDHSYPDNSDDVPY